MRHGKNLARVEKRTERRIGKADRRLVERIQLRGGGVEREHGVRVMSGLGVIDQDRKQIGVSWSLRADDDTQRRFLCPRRCFERLIQRRPRTTNLAQFVMNQQHGRKPICSCGIGTERAIACAQFRAGQ